MSTLASPDWDVLLTAAHVWHVSPDDLPSGMLQERCLTWLTPEEIAQRAKFRTDRLQHAYLATRALCRIVLSRYTGVDPAAWKFVAEAHGKPAIAGPAGFESLRFNLTHTDGLVACVVSRAGEVGIDAEETSREVEFAQVARHFFSAAEQAQLADLPPEQLSASFFAQWVLKEAYLKGLGTGLSQSPELFTIQWDRDGNPLPLEDWQFTLHHPTPRHVAAVAVKIRSDSGPIANHWFDGKGLI